MLKIAFIAIAITMISATTLNSLVQAQDHYPPV